jgi:cycloartenol synthase
MFLMPGMVITLHTTGALHTVLSLQHIAEMIRYLANHQNGDGGYGLHIEGHSTMFGTALRWVRVARGSGRSATRLSCETQ